MTGVDNHMAIRNKNWVYPRRLMGMVFVAFLSGCGMPFFEGYAPAGHSRDEFEKYVETVFRFQNSMTSEVMMLSDSGFVGDFDRLLQAEQHMQKVCEPLNQYVSRDMDGLSTGFLLRRQVVKSTRDCDHAAHEVEVLLNGE